MTHPFRLARLLLVVAALSAVPGIGVARELKLEAQLVWGANQETSPDPKLKPVAPDVEKRLHDLPLKWRHYFEVNRKKFEVAHDGTQRISLSKDCIIIVKNLSNDQVEVTLLGKGVEVGRIKQKLPDGELLVLAGNSPDFTGWLVVLRQVR